MQSLNIIDESAAHMHFSMTSNSSNIYNRTGQEIIPFVLISGLFQSILYSCYWDNVMWNFVLYVWTALAHGGNILVQGNSCEKKKRHWGKIVLHVWMICIYKCLMRHFLRVGDAVCFISAQHSLNECGFGLYLHADVFSFFRSSVFFIINWFPLNIMTWVIRFFNNIIAQHNSQLIQLGVIMG